MDLCIHIKAYEIFATRGINKAAGCYKRIPVHGCFARICHNVSLSIQFITSFFRKAKQQAQEGGNSSQYFFDTAHYSDEEEEEHEGGRGRKRRGKGDGPEIKKFQQQITEDQCWFCLSNVKAERHLVSLNNFYRF
jgi:hypothetical protein